MTTNQLDTKQFNDCKADSGFACDTPVIRKLSAESPATCVSKTQAPLAKSNKGRKRKYNTPEERLEARRLQQKQYRERKKQQAQQLKQTSDEGAKGSRGSIGTLVKEDA